MEGDFKSRFKLPYEPPQIFDLWTSTAHAQDEKAKQCMTGHRSGETQKSSFCGRV